MLRKILQNLKSISSKHKGIVICFVVMISMATVLPITAGIIDRFIREKNIDALLLLGIFLIIAVRIYIDAIMNWINKDD